MTTLFALIASFTDNFTYTNDVFCGVFRSPELAEAAKKIWLRTHSDVPDYWRISRISIDEVQ